MYKKMVASVGLLSCFVSAANENLTSLANDNVAGDEIYRISLRAPEIDNNTFPVPVLYFDDLLNKKSYLKATLNVPLKLSIENSRKRRLLTLFSLNGEENIPYGENLGPLSQIKLSSYEDSSGKLVFEKFVGPNKLIFRAIEDNTSIDYDFILPITHKHFHDGFVTVAIASTNGVQLSELCEVNETRCVQTVTFKIIPRRIVYEFNASPFSDFYRADELQETFRVIESNVDLKLDINNAHIIDDKVEQVDINRKELPFEYETPFILLPKWRPHTISRAENKTRVVNLDIHPVIHYMSSNAYAGSDVIIETSAFRGPDVFVKNGAKGDELLDHLNTLDPLAERDDFGIISSQSEVEQQEVGIEQEAGIDAVEVEAETETVEEDAE